SGREVVEALQTAVETGDGVAVRPTRRRARAGAQMVVYGFLPELPLVRVRREQVEVFIGAVGEAGLERGDGARVELAALRREQAAVDHLADQGVSEATDAQREEFRLEQDAHLLRGVEPRAEIRFWETEDRLEQIGQHLLADHRGRAQ